MELAVLQRLEPFKRLQEATTTVKAHVSHSKSGKAFTVKQFERNVGGERGDPRNLSLPFPKRAALTPLKLSGAFTDPLASHYHYHATNIENAYDIAAHGLQPHEPSYGTDQQAWPDGSTQLRSYFGTPDSVWSFAPENGTPVVLRVKRNAARFRAESGTGDTYVRSTIRPKYLEILTDKGWRPISVLAQQQQVHEAHVRAYVRRVKGKQVQVAAHERHVFYRGTVPGETKRIKEPFGAAVGKTFVARTVQGAKSYGPSIEKFESLPGAKVLYDHDPAFWRLIGKRRPPNGYLGSALRGKETLIDLVNRAVTRAAAKGYDAVSIGDADIGTIILNDKMFSRSPLQEAETTVHQYTKRSKSGKAFTVHQHSRQYEKSLQVIRAAPHGLTLHPSILKLKHHARPVEQPEKAKTSDTLMSGEVNLTPAELKQRQVHIDNLSKASSAWLKKNVPSGKPDMRDLAMFSKYLSEKHAKDIDAITALMEDRTKYLNRPAVYVDVPNGPSLYILGWRDRAGDIEGTEIHDHANSQAGVHVHKGVVTERLFGVSKKDFGKDTLSFKAIDRDLYQGGSISVTAPYIHEVYDKSDENFSVTVHSYYPPLKEMSFYTVKGDKLIKSGHWKEDDPAKAPVKEAVTTVKQHVAHSKRGHAYLVRQHPRNYQAAQKMKIIGATPNEDKYIRELLSRHDPKILAAVPYIAVLDRKDFKRMLRKATDYRADGSEVGWYDEKKSFIVINRTLMTVPEWKSTLDHELGHAAYWHSLKGTQQWRDNYHGDKKFDRFTWYAKTDVSEGFAESYMAYIAAGGKAKKPRYRRVFDVVKTVIRGVNPKFNVFKKEKA